MSKFESFSPVVESLEDKKGMSLEQRKSVIEKVINKYPRLRSLVLAFMTTTATMSAPELVEPGIPVQGVRMEQKDSSNSLGIEATDLALEKIDDVKFRQIVDKIRDEMKTVGSNIPKNSVYSELWQSSSVNDDASFAEKNTGDLPESAQHVLIGSEHLSGTYTHDGAVVNVYSGTKTSFYVSPVEGGTVTEGGKVEMLGIGSTRGKALQNALENSVKFLGEEVTSNTDLDDKIVDNDTNPSAESTFTEVIKVESNHYVTGYKIVKGEEVKDGKRDHEYRVVVEVRGGTFTPGK